MSITAINSPNQFRGKVLTIQRGPVVSEVEVQVRGGIVTAVITTSSLTELDIAVGSEVLAVVKSSEIALARLYNGIDGHSPYLD